MSPVPVQFTDASQGNPTGYLWNFGDGTPSSTEKNPLHNYTAEDTYQVRETISKPGYTPSTIIKPVVLARTPAAWWKGEDNFLDSIQPGIALVPSNTGLSPRFTNGIVNRCFIVDKTGPAWDSLTIGAEGTTQAKTNISSFDIWELELYVKFSSLTGWFYLFQAYDYIEGDDFIAASIDLEHDYIDIYNQDGGPGDPYPKFENLGLQAGVWYKIRLVHTKATNKWGCFVNGIEKTAFDIDTMPVNPHEYTAFFAGEDWNSPVLNVDEIKVFTTL
jgi:PKD repeat protein